VSFPIRPRQLVRGCIAGLSAAEAAAAAVRGSAGALCCGALRCAALQPSADALLGAGPDDIPVPTYHKSPRFELGDPAAHAYLEDEGYVSSSPFSPPSCSPPDDSATPYAARRSCTRTSCRRRRSMRPSRSSGTSWRRSAPASTATTQPPGTTSSGTRAAPAPASWATSALGRTRPCGT